MDPARLNFSGKPLGTANPYVGAGGAKEETIATVEVVPEHERRLSSVELDNVDPDELPLMTTFLFCIPIEAGIRIIAFLDFVATAAWIVEMFAHREIWWMFFMYTVLGVNRLYYFVRLEMKDGFHVRKHLYYSHLASNLSYVFIFILGFFIIWFDYGDFPGMFLLW